MLKENFYIGRTPTVVYGDKSDKVFIFVHGKGGNKEEGERFAKVALYGDYQVISVDLPEHGNRKDGVKFVPWEVVSELKKVYAYARGGWKQIAVRATSIGSYFSLLAFKNVKIDRCLFASPLLDMENMIDGLMTLSGVTEEWLEKEGEIPTDFGETLSWKYLCYARENPVAAISRKTSLLYATGDETISRGTVERFANENKCRLTVMDGGEHWLHTPEEVKFMEEWERENIAD